MGIVSNYASPEAKDALRRQRRNASLSSVLIAILVVVLLGMTLALIFLPGYFVETASIVTYNAGRQEEEKLEKREVPRQVKRQPSAPSSSMARVIASTTPSPTAIPVPDVNVPDPSTDFGSGDDFGDGWGSGDGAGGGGGTTFFGQTSAAERVAFVIDFSASMNGSREALMRAELKKSLEKMVPGTKFQMVFFAGPAWVAGNRLKSNRKTAEVKGNGGHKYDWRCGGGAHSWQPVGKRQIPEWLEATDGNISKAQKHVKETKLVWGTIWKPPLEMALSMEPCPQVIYFMTDGSAGKGSGQTAKTIGTRARSKGITINCVAMMEPRAHADMLELAKRTDGQFTKVLKGGKVEKVR